LHEADLGSARFDKTFAIHVGVLLRGHGRELGVVSAHLAPGGRFYLPYQPLVPHLAAQSAQQLSTDLVRHGFTVTDTLIEDLTAARVGCVIAQSSAG